MAGLLVAISTVLFLAGFLAGAFLVIIIGIRSEDRAAMDRHLAVMRELEHGGPRQDDPILLHQEPGGAVSRGVRRLSGAGQRNRPRR